MLKGNHKLFANKQLLYQCVNLRLIGWALTSIGNLFNCHRSSAKDQCQKYGIVPPNDIYDIERITSKLVPQQESKWKIVNGVKVNKGKSYLDYLPYPHRNKIKKYYY